MSAQLAEFRSRYRAAFETYLQARDEGALSAAYELGRAAVASGVSVLDLAAIHHDSLADVLQTEGDPGAVEAVTREAGNFFVESMSAFEMAQRVLQQTREAAIVQERHATILRRLSTFLADASIAFDAAGSLQEMLQLVAEHARELLGARWCDVRLSSEDMGPLALEAAAGSDTAPRLDPHRFAALYHTMRPEGGPLRMTATELARQPAQETLEQGKMRTQPVRGWLAASLARLDGEVLGLVQLFDKQDGDFSELDEAVLVQLAQMSSAAVERARLYRSAE